MKTDSTLQSLHFIIKINLAVSKSSQGTSDLKFEVRSLKIPVQNGCQKTHTRDSNQSVIIKITQQKLKWSPKNSQNLVQTLCYLESHNSPLVSLIAFFKIRVCLNRPMPIYNINNISNTLFNISVIILLYNDILILYSALIMFGLSPHKLY